MNTPPRITVTEATVTVAGQSVTFSTWRAANEAMNKLREPSHEPAPGRSYFMGAADRNAFAQLQALYQAAMLMLC